MKKVYTLTLDDRDHQILRLMAEGKTAAKIGRALDISGRTVEHHQEQLRDFFKAKNNVNLIHLAHLKQIL